MNDLNQALAFLGNPDPAVVELYPPPAAGSASLQAAREHASRLAHSGEVEARWGERSVLVSREVAGALEQRGAKRRNRRD